MMCRTLVEHTTDYLEARLEGSVLRAFRIHLALCPYCKRHMKQVETTIGTLHALREQAPDDASRERAIARFRASKK